MKLRKKQSSYKDTIKIPKKLKDKLPTSYDIIGDIILIKIPKEFNKYN